MSHSQYQNHELIILNVINDSVVSDANTIFTAAPSESQTSRRAWFVRQRLDRDFETRGNLRVQPPEMPLRLPALW